MEISYARTPLDILESNNISLAIIQQQKKGRALAKKPLNNLKSTTNDKIQKKREY